MHEKPKMPRPILRAWTAREWAVHWMLVAGVALAIIGVVSIVN